MEYRFLHLAGDAWEEVAGNLAATVVPAWRAGRAEVWGAWRGVFGLGSGDLYVIVRAEPGAGLHAALAGIASVAADRPLIATARPADAETCGRPGLYVFRSFTVAVEDIDRFVALSAEAWETFEAAASYDARPMGLFRDGAGGMLLVTWYESFAGWEASRAFVPGAREAFRARRALVSRGSAVATALVPGFGAPA